MSNPPFEQPGLEVVRNNGWEAPEYYPSNHQDPRDKDGLHVTDTPDHSIPIMVNEQGWKPNNEVAQGKPNRWKTRKCRLIIAAVVVVLCLAIAGGVAGGVLASRSSNDAAAPSSSPSTPAASGTTTSAPSSVTSLASIKPNSPLAVTGWREATGVEIDLYYQAPDNQVRTSKYDSGRGSVTSNNSYWENSTVLDITVSPTSSLAAAMILFIDVFAPQVQMVGVDSSSRLVGVDRNPKSNPQVGTDSINSKAYTVPETNRIAAYWPYILFQDSSGELKEVMNALNAADFHAPESDWTLNGLGIFAMVGTGLAIVPLDVNFTNIVSDGGYGVVYQGTGGQLSISVPGKTSNTNGSWSTASAFPTISFPKGNSIAAFSTARPNDKTGRVNTYILYQAEDNSIQMVWLDNESGWETSAPHALAVADNGTDIACLTMPTSELDTKSQVLLLEAASDVSRCYFQRGGVPREVMLSGTDWVELGSVPMP
ncbi:hypothetical protein GQ53DRAFT_740473 [Thozetella sp. PMI_491]|nr:hypothetical protein GQ53DRAFT_740473 [Thozetella sp. PMI_491]